MLRRPPKPRYRTSSGGRLAFHTSPAGQSKANPAQRRSGPPPMPDQSADTTPGKTEGRRVRKSVASRYYQLFSGHAAIGTFLRGRVTGPQKLEPDKCWCNCGKRKMRHRLLLNVDPRPPDQKAGGGLATTVAGSTRGRRQLGGCERRKLLGRYWSSWRTQWQAAGLQPE